MRSDDIHLFEGFSRDGRFILYQQLCVYYSVISKILSVESNTSYTFTSTVLHLSKLPHRDLIVLIGSIEKILNAQNKNTILQISITTIT